MFRLKDQGDKEQADKDKGSKDKGDKDKSDKDKSDEPYELLYWRDDFDGPMQSA